MSLPSSEVKVTEGLYNLVQRLDHVARKLAVGPPAAGQGGV